VINRETGQTGKIKKSNRFFKFELIEEFVENWAEIGVDFDRSVNPLREFASDTSEIIPIDPQSKLKTESSEKISIKGDWIEVQTSDSEKGWVRWRQGNQILIRLYYSY
jgi:hypothetical protein